MTRDDVVRIASESGFITGTRNLVLGMKTIQVVQPVNPGNILPELEHFEEKVIEHFLATTEQYVTNDASREEVIRKAVKECREECAALCDRFALRDMSPAECASAIRAWSES